MKKSLQENVTILNIYAPNNGASKYMWQKKTTELQGETQQSTIIIGNFSASLIVFDKQTKYL